jgi:hypothetical protein
MSARRRAGAATRWAEPLAAAPLALALAALLLAVPGGAAAQAQGMAPPPTATAPHARAEAADGSFGLPEGVEARSVGFSAADGRTVHARLWWPSTRPRGGRTRGLILFSHGANSQPAKYDRLAGAWARAGWVVVGPVHMDSPDHPDRPQVSPDQGLALRLADLRTPLAWLGGIERATGLRIPAERIIVAGHSYGALSAQALAGASVRRPGDGGPTPDPRIRAVVAFSPPGPIPGYVEAGDWAGVAVPQFVQTGTADLVPPLVTRWEAHRASFEAARVRPALLWVGEGVDHYFGNLIGRPEREAPDQSTAFSCALTASLAFMDLALGDRRARPEAPCGPPGLVRVEAR